jgi:hypothetical protein
VTVLVAGILVAVMTAIGLLVDSSLALSAHRRANNEAEQAARAAGQALDLSAYTAGGAARLDPAAARAAATAYLATTGDRSTVTVTGPGEVTVTVTITVRTRFLWAVGRPTVSATGTGHSVDLFGH